MVGPPRQLSPGVAWRMVPMNDDSGGVMLLHQMAVDDEVNPSGAGYGSLRPCTAIVQAGVSVLSPDGVAPPGALGFATVSLAVDVAVSPDHTQMALAVPANNATPQPTVVAGPVAMINVANAGPGCSGIAAPTSGAPRGEVIA